MSKTQIIDIAFESSVISTMTFEATSKTHGALTVRFVNGSEYLYPSVHKMWVNDFINADSIGFEFSIFKKCVSARMYDRIK